MPTLGERIKDTAINVIGGRSYRERQERTAELIEHAYRRGPAIMPTQSLLQRLGEVDGRLLDLFIQQQGYRLIHGQYVGAFKLSEQDRLRAVEQSRWYYHYYAQFENAVTEWTDFGFGQQISIVPLDEDARKVWGECFTARRNSPMFKQRKLHDLSKDELVDGEIFFAAWASTVDGAVTWRRFATEDVKRIVYDQDDTDVPVFYVVGTDTGEIYFPDWQPTAEELDEEWARIKKATPGARRADEMAPSVEIGGNDTPRTDVRIMHAAVDRRDGRGWPRFYRAIEWVEAQKTHIGDHLTVAKAVATFVDEFITKSGSRGVDAVAAKFASSLTTSSEWMERNPSAAAGSILTHNDAVEVNRRPLATGAGDALTTTGLIVGQISSATKIPPHYMGFPQFMQNRATARESSRPFIEQIERYQEFWADVFQDMVEITLMFAAQYNPEYRGGFGSAEAEVTFESPQPVVPDEIARVIDSVSRAASAGVASPDIAQQAIDWLIAAALVSLGARNVPSILEPGEQASAPVEATTIEKIAAEIGAAMAAGDVSLSEALTWAIATAAEKI